MSTGVIRDEHRLRRAQMRHKQIALEGERLDARIHSLESLATQGTLLAGFSYSIFKPDEINKLLMVNNQQSTSLMGPALIALTSAVSFSSAVWVVYLTGYAAIRARLAFLQGSEPRAVKDAIMVLRYTHERARDYFDMSLATLVISANCIIFEHLPTSVALTLMLVFLLFLLHGVTFKRAIDRRLEPWVTGYVRTPPECASRLDRAAERLSDALSVWYGRATRFWAATVQPWLAEVRWLPAWLRASARAADEPELMQRSSVREAVALSVPNSYAGGDLSCAATMPHASRAQDRRGSHLIPGVGGPDMDVGSGQDLEVGGPCGFGFGAGSRTAAPAASRVDTDAPHADRRPLTSLAAAGAPFCGFGAPHASCSMASISMAQMPSVRHDVSGAGSHLLSDEFQDWVYCTRRAGQLWFPPKRPTTKRYCVLNDLDGQLLLFSSKEYADLLPFAAVRRQPTAAANGGRRLGAEAESWPTAGHRQRVATPSC